MLQGSGRPMKDGSTWAITNGAPPNLEELFDASAESILEEAKPTSLLTSLIFGS